jgi:hypothetical protein
MKTFETKKEILLILKHIEFSFSKEKEKAMMHL